MEIDPQLYARADHLRRSPFSAGAGTGHKEWLHFCIHEQGMDLLVNFSTVDDMRPIATPGAEHARLTILARDTCWDGVVENFANSDVCMSGGAVDMHFGPNSCVLIDGRYHIRVRTKKRGINADLVLTPHSKPAVANNVRMDSGTPMNWAVTPRLSAAGTVSIGGRRWELLDSPAYHDHNWGRWHWGRDFAWEWACALPEDQSCPWTVVFARLNDRAHGRTYTQGLYVWRHDLPRRTFRDREMQVIHEGFHPPERVFRIPRPMALISTGEATDVPSEVHVIADGEGDRAELHFRAEDLSQVILPDDERLFSTTIINEVCGHLSVRGEVAGERFEIEGPSIFEFVRGSNA